MSGSGARVPSRSSAAARVLYADPKDVYKRQNIRRMAAGIALTDEDRHDWLIAIAERIANAAHNGEALVVTCSALKRRYREMLRGDVAHLVLSLIHI